jgi:putative peptidoglycan lipid II flippase
LGLRMVLSLAVPAGVGLVVLAQPLIKLLIESGQFTASDTARAATTTAWFSASVWAYCAAPVVVRGFYALDDSRTPVRVGLCIVALDLTLGLALIWPMAESGLALSTAISAAAHIFVLMWLFSRKHASLRSKELIASSLRTIIASAIMAIVCYLALAWLPADDRKMIKLLRVAVPVFLGSTVYLGVFRLIGGREISMLWTGVEK